MNRRRRSSGSTVLEFALVGVPIMMVFISIAQMSLTMWAYQTLSYTAKELNRYIGVHGTHCGSGTNSCKLTVGDVATAAQTFAIGMNSGTLNLYLTSPNGSYSCAPVSTCTSNSNSWPPSSDSTVGSIIKVKLQYQVSPVFNLVWPGTRNFSNQSYNLQAFSEQRVLF